MWPFLRKQSQTGEVTDGSPKSELRPMKFAQLLESMGDFKDFADHDIAMKFWLPEPASEALKELSAINGDSASETLRQFFAHHCYGVYCYHLMTKKIPGIFKDPGPTMFARGPGNESAGKKRVVTYWVPELGKNVIPIKVWVPTRIRNDLQILAAHVELNLSQYVREIVISRLLGHGTLPYRPEMLDAAPLPSAQDWCDGKDVAMRLISPDEVFSHLEVRAVTEWVAE